MRPTLDEIRGGGRVIHGSVSSSGGIVRGTGFSVVHSGTGIYIVTFLLPFKSSPDVTITTTPGGISGASLNGTPTAISFGVLTVAAGFTALADEPFSFIAIGENPA